MASSEGRIATFIECKPSNTVPYLRVSLTKDNKKLSSTKHSIIARTFLGERPRDYDVDHINRNKLDNRLENLRYVSKSQNILNQGVQKRNTTGLSGIQKMRNGRFRIRIVRNHEVVLNREAKTLEKAVSILNLFYEENPHYKRELGC